jgi:hypothetical protein
MFSFIFVLKVFPLDIGWYRIFLNTHKGKEYQTCVAGDWLIGRKETYKGYEDSDISKGELKKWKGLGGPSIIKPSSLIPERMFSFIFVLKVFPLDIEGHDKTTDF